MQARIPIATYRQQFNREHTFRAAAELADYLQSLGVSHVYASPIFTAAPGSMHGYDVVDHSRLNPEVGTEEEFRAFVTALVERDMALMVDIVPNHMCITSALNRWWSDILEDGPSSPFASFFDVDWNPPQPDLSDVVLLPVLGDQYGRILENQEIRITYEDGAFFTEYYALRLPVAPKSWGPILGPAVGQLRVVRGESDPVVLELESILTALGHLPSRTQCDAASVRERQREKMIIKARLAALVEANPDARQAIDDALTALNGSKGVARSFDRLEALLAEQAYRLSYWRVATDEINYRRFFDINELAAIRVEEPTVFNAVHGLVLRLMSQGLVHAVRIDHPDGLYDPERYFKDLQRGCLAAMTTAIAGPGVPEAAADVAGSGEIGRPCYCVVEKILVKEEQLRPNWAVHGTTGYDYMNLLNGVFVDASAGKAFRELYERFTGERTIVDDLVYECKKTIMEVSLSSELHVLARKLERISEQHRWSRDFTFRSLHDALREVIACFPVYRTYITSEDRVVATEDRRHVLFALRSAKRRNPATNESIFDFIGSILLLEDPDGLSDEQRAFRREWVMRFQQLTGPVTAKGLEDTAFYRYFPLSSLNEVGGDPDRFGVTPRQFHEANSERFVLWPHGLCATSTHDTKRSEDVRARINVLSEIPAGWENAIARWREMNKGRKTRVEGADAPYPDEEYLFYQTLIGVWPFVPVDDAGWAQFIERAQGYMNKAIKEAKLRTSWINPNTEHERAVRDFVSAVLERGPENPFVPDFNEFVAPIAKIGVYNALSQTLLKVASPGVPDFYQGTEMWEFALVDPDNRRRVDYGARRDALAALDREAEPDPAALAERLLRAPEDGRIKLYVTSRALRLRRAQRELFERGEYVPLEVSPEREEHVVAFARATRDRGVLVVAGRFFSRLGGATRLPVGSEVWGDATLSMGNDLGGVTYRDAFTGAELRPELRGEKWTLPLSQVFGRLPLALLERV